MEQYIRVCHGSIWWPHNSNLTYQWYSAVWVIDGSVRHWRSSILVFPSEGFSMVWIGVFTSNIASDSIFRRFSYTSVSWGISRSCHNGRFTCTSPQFVDQLLWNTSVVYITLQMDPMIKVSDDIFLLFKSTQCEIANCDNNIQFVDPQEVVESLHMFYCNQLT